MVTRRHGRILNVVSLSGTMAIPYLSAYFTAKTALVRLSEVLALETREHGIAVFAVDPGGGRAAMTDAGFGSPAGRRWLPGYADRMERDNPTPERAAALCVQLAAGKADVLSRLYLRVGDDLADLVARVAELRAQERSTLRLHR